MTGLHLVIFFILYQDGANRALFPHTQGVGLGGVVGWWRGGLNVLLLRWARAVYRKI